MKIFCAICLVHSCEKSSYRKKNQLTVGITVALQIDKASIDQKNMRKRVHEEVRIHIQLRHPSIVKVSSCLDMVYPSYS